MKILSVFTLRMPAHGIIPCILAEDKGSSHGNIRLAKYSSPADNCGSGWHMSEFHNETYKRPEAYIPTGSLKLKTL